MILAVDTSAVLAILLDEPEMLAFVRAIRAAERAVISAASVVQIYRVAHARAVRQSLSAPLLFKGDDFAQTDLVAAWRP